MYQGVESRRSLAIYPTCAVLDDFYERQACCDEIVQSAAGRDYCYNDVTHNEGKFDTCLSNAI